VVGKVHTTEQRKDKRGRRICADISGGPAWPGRAPRSGGSRP